jgi:hypothetical protein
MSSMSEYSKPCIYPKTEIKMSNKSDGRWLPYDFDWSGHDCKHDAKESVNGVYTNNTESKNASTVEERLARLEEGVFGDIE